METKPQNTPTTSKKFNNAWIYIPLVILLIVSNVILYYKKNAQDEVHQDVLVVKDSTIVTLKAEYDASLVRLDDLMGKNAQLDSLLNDKNSEVGKIKARINELTKKQKMTEEEYREAKALIGSLRKRIDGYESEIAALKTANAGLTEQVSALTSANETLAQEIDLGKILFASNIELLPIDLRKKGSKEVETSKARRVDVLRIKFDIVKNLLESSGNKEFYILIYNPDGTLLSNPGLGSGGFTLPDGATKYYSISKNVFLEKGQELKGITVDWNQAASYAKGNYTVEIYHKGYEVGKGTVALK